MKQIKRKFSKAFTLIELVVVIAVIAVLGAVSVVAYMGVINSANKSADEQLCAQYNDIAHIAKVNDEDGRVTLVELKAEIENQGLNFNDFATSSSSYVFAYDMVNTTCVLLDKDSGEVQYPANYTGSSSTSGLESENNEVSLLETSTSFTNNGAGLWRFLANSFEFQTGVYNYAFTRSMQLTNSYNEKFKNRKTYTFDLNNNVLVVDSGFTATSSLYLDNYGDGQSYVKNNTSNNISLGNVKKLDTSSTTNVVIIDKTSSSSKPVTVEDKKEYYSVEQGSTAAGVTGTEINFNSGTNASSKNEKTITESSFSNTVLKWTAQSNGDSLTIKDCTFYNAPTGQYPITIQTNGNTGVKVTIENCVFNNCVRGINVSFPIDEINASELSSISIKGCTFKLVSQLTGKSEDKSNCLQINAENFQTSKKVTFNDSDSDTSKTKIKLGKIEFSNNKVENAHSAITVHDTFDTSLISKENIQLTASNNFSISGNAISSSIPKTSIDASYDKEKKTSEVAVAVQKVVEEAFND